MISRERWTCYQGEKKVRVRRVIKGLFRKGLGLEHETKDSGRKDLNMPKILNRLRKPFNSSSKSSATRTLLF